MVQTHGLSDSHSQTGERPHKAAGIVDANSGLELTGQLRHDDKAEVIGGKVLPDR